MMPVARDLETVDIVLDMETQDPDDVICLIFLASHPRVRLKAITLVPGSREQVGLVRHLLDHLDLSDVAVGAGDTAGPLAKRGTVSPWHSRAFFDGTTCPESDAAEPAAHVLLRVCDVRTTLVTGGPLTNIARAIALGPTARGESGGLVAGTWLAQGGFAGDGVVPPDARLPKFAGHETMHTFNFQ